jgi:hypothetical protein
VSTTIPILAMPAAAAAGCGACAASKARWACGEASFAPVLSPTLVGQPEQIHRVMHALVCDLGEALGSEEDGAGLVRSLRLDAHTDEAELALAVPAHCGGGRLADVAFQTLRRLLPNTDIYVTHAP